MSQKKAKCKKIDKGLAAGAAAMLSAVCLLWVLGWNLANDFRSWGGGFESGPVVNASSNDELLAVFTDSAAYPVMVMIDNSPEARVRHAGLSDALVIYETLAEGGATRLAVLFVGAPVSERVGPVRSARPYFVAMAAGWDSLFMHAGGSPEALSLIPKTSVTGLNEISGLGVRYFWRDNTRRAPHNLFTSGSLIKLALADFDLVDLPLEKLFWRWGSKEMPANAVPAASVYLDFSAGILFDSSYEYDAALGAYKRYLAGEPHLDTVSGEQLVAANIIVQRVPAEGYYPSGYDRIIIETVGEGEFLLFKNGQVIQGTWKKENTESQTQWLGPDGEQVILKPGQTWVHVLPGARDVIIE